MPFGLKNAPSVLGLHCFDMFLVMYYVFVLITNYYFYYICSVSNNKIMILLCWTITVIFPYSKKAICILLQLQFCIAHFLIQFYSTWLIIRILHSSGMIMNFWCRSLLDSHFVILAKSVIHNTLYRKSLLFYSNWVCSTCTIMINQILLPTFCLSTFPVGVLAPVLCYLK